MTQKEETALIAGQLADLTKAVKDMADQLISIRERLACEALVVWARGGVEPLERGK